MTIFGVASPVIPNEFEGGPRRTTFKANELDPQHTDQTVRNMIPHIFYIIIMSFTFIKFISIR